MIHNRKIAIADILSKYLCHNRKKGSCFFFLFLSFPIFFILFMEIQYFALACFVSQIARTLCELSEYIIILCILSKQKHKLEYFHNSSSKIANIFYKHDFIFEPRFESKVLKLFQVMFWLLWVPLWVPLWNPLYKISL